MSFRIGLISDELTRASLKDECKVYDITPLNYKWVLRFKRPDILFVESAWNGWRGAWKYRIASYDSHPSRSNFRLRQVVDYARSLGVPTVFWNKEDGVHFGRFIDSAAVFDHIFTVAEECVGQYREAAPHAVSVNPLLFAVQKRSHFFNGFNFRLKSANFVGSYSHHLHVERRHWQDMAFAACFKNNLEMHVFDRNSGRKSDNYRYPRYSNVTVHKAVEHSLTAQIYKNYLISLNVNTVTDSTTMFSRRLVEILACGGIAVTNPSLAVTNLFRDYCHIVADATQMNELLARLKFGPSSEDLERAEAGASYVERNHSWTHRIHQIREIIGV